MNQRNWTPEESKWAQSHYEKRLAEGAPDSHIFAEIGKQVGRTANSVSKRFVRGKRSFAGKYRAPSRIVTGLRITRPFAPIPEEVLAERNRAALLGYQSVTSVICGDPLPGRSALDRLNSE